MNLPVLAIWGIILYGALCLVLWLSMMFSRIHLCCSMYCYFISFYGWKICQCIDILHASWVAQLVKNRPAMEETLVWFLGQKDTLEKKMALSSYVSKNTTPVFLPGESPWTEEPGRLQSIGSRKVGHDWVTKDSTTQTYYIWLFIYPLMEIWVISTFWLSWIVLLWSFIFKNLFEYLLLILWG